jgi:hypothetical protein
MGNVYATSKRTGREYLVSIAGDTATPQELANIERYVDAVEGFGAPAIQPEEESGTGNLIDFAQGVASGVARGIADVPGGLASLTAAALRYTVPGNQGEDTIEAFGQGITDAARTGIDYAIGTPEDNIAGKSGQAIGSIGSYFLGGAGVAKGLSALGKSTKAQRIGGTAAAATMGVGQGSQNQVDRIARFIEQGGDPTERDLAILTGGAIGASEALPISKLFGVIANMLKKVPKEAKESAIKSIGQRLKSAGKVGLAEGAQEVGAAIAQDLTEKGLYNPDLDISQSAYSDDAIYGGGAGATFSFLLETVAGRRVKKFVKARAQLAMDQREEAAEIKEQVERSKGSLNEPDKPESVAGLLPGPVTQETVEEQQTEEDLTGQPTEATKAFNQNLKNLGLNQDQEQIALAEAAREMSLGEQPIDISELSEGEQAAIRQYRVRAGVGDIDGPTTLEEVRNVLGRETFNRLGARQRPRTFEKELSEEEKALAAESSKIKEKVIDNKDSAKILVESGEVSNKDGSISRAKLQRALSLNAREAQALIDNMKKEGVVEPISKTKVKPVNAPQLPTEQQEAERSAETILAQLVDLRRQQQENVDAIKGVGVGSQMEQLELEDNQRVLDDLDARIKVQEGKLSAVRAAAPPNPSAPQARNNQALVVQQEAEESKPTDDYKRKINTVANALRKYLFGLGLSDVDLVTQNVIDYSENTEADGSVSMSVVEGTEKAGADARRIITLAMEIYDPNLSEAELEQRLAGVLNHEIIHAMKGLGLFTDAEWASLVKAAEKRKYVKMVNGRRVEREYTFLDRAESMYPEDNAEAQQEEAVAEMFRAYADGRIRVGGKPKSLFGRMVQFIKSIFNAHADAGFTSAAELFDNIKSGKVGRRQRNIQAASIAPAGAKYSTAGVRAGFLIPEKGNVERIQQSFKDVTNRIPKLTEAAQKLYDGTILYDEYDRLVNDLKPIIPYETVPAPATYEDMVRGLTEEKKIAKIGRLNEIDEGERIKLRLDIPSYTRQGVWVPTIHDTNGAVLSHESTAIITNADFMHSEIQQEKSLDIARRRPFGDPKRGKRMGKTPFATVTGNLKKASPDEAFSIAQQMMNDPDVVQVGFDPERHSYFYDRMTTQPVIGADMVVQVGPLLLAKNPVFGNKSEFKYSVRTIRNMPTNLIGPIPIVHDVKARYMNAVGLPNRRQGEYVQIDLPLATRIAGAFEEAEDTPNDPEVRVAYQAMANETMAQWQFIKDTGLDVEFIKGDMDNPYPNGSRDVLIDIRDNNHMWVFPTDAGFGQSSITAEDEALNPLLVRAGETIDGIDMRINDVFRIVHDYFGHGLEGATFTARGEENAWQSHVRMYSPTAAKAMTTETRGQNSWVNFGPFGEQNRENPASTTYADQKMTILPDFVMEEGIAPDLESTNEQERINRSIKRSSISGDARSDRSRVDRVGTGSGNVRGEVPAGQEADLGTPKPTVDENGLTRLVHYSPVAGLEMVSPSEQLTNNRMRGDERERKVKFPSIYQARSYFGMNVGEANGYNQEATVGNNVYETKVPVDSLYDYDNDPDGFIAKAADSVDDNIMERTWGKPKQFITTTAEKSIKDAGYSGYWSNSRMGMVAAMFNDTAVQPKGALEKPVKKSVRTAYIDVPNVNNVNEARISQRVPMGTGATEDPITDILQLSADNIIDNPKLLAKTAEIVREYNIITEEEAASLDDKQIIELLIERLSSNLEFIYDSVNPETRERSKLWYVGANRIANENAIKYSEESGGEISVEQAAAVMAALSPQKDWYQNVSLGERLIDIYKTKMDMTPTPEMEATARRIFGKRSYQPMLDIIFRQGRNMPLSEYDNAPLLQAMFIRIYDETYNDRGYYIVSPDGQNIGWARTKNGSRARVAWGSNKEITKAVMALSDPKSIPVEMGDRHKVRNFFNNIAAPFSQEGDVTSDTHAVAAAHMKPLSGSSTEVHHNFGTSPTASKRDENWRGAVSNSKNLGVKGTYALYVEAHRRAAARRKVLPREMQSITWEAVRGLFTPAFKQNKNNIRMVDGIWNEFRAGRKTIDEVRKEILDAAGDKGRFRPPSWEGPDSGSLRSAELAVDEGELSGSVVSRSNPIDYSGDGVGATRGTVAPETKYSKRSVRYTPPQDQGFQPMVSNEAMLRASEESYDRITYNNVSRVLGNLYSKVFDETKAKAWEARTERFVTKFQDAMLPVGKLMDELRSDGLSIPDAMDVYMREELAQGLMGYRLEENKANLYEPLTDTIKQIDIEQDKLDQLAQLSYFFNDASQAYDPKLAVADAYLYALHAKERNAYVESRNQIGLGSGMSDVEADSIINWVESLDIQNKNTLNGIKNIVGQIVQNTNDVRREGGLMAEEYSFSNYVPLRGNLDPEEDLSDDLQSVPRVGRKLRNNLYGGRAYQDPRITTGRGPNYAEDIIANVMVQNSRSIVSAERNKVGQSFLNIIDPKIMDPNAEYIMPKEDRDGIAIIIDKVTPDIQENVLKVKVNGRQEPYNVLIRDNRVARAMRGAGGDGIQRGAGLVRFLGKFNRYLSTINTSYNPEFAITNFARDLGTAGVNIAQYDEEKITREVLKNAGVSVLAIAKRIRDNDTSSEWAQIYEDFRANGGKNSTNSVDTVKDQMENIQNILNDVSNKSLKGKLGLSRNGFVYNIGKFLDDYNTAVENGVRVATYKALLDRGYSKDRAAQAARNVTVNFAKQGEEKMLMNALYLFYNASVQGSMALMNAAIKSPKVRKIWGGMVIYGLLSDQLFSAMSGDDDEDGKSDWDEIGDYTHEHNLLIPTLGLIDQKYIKIPLGYGINTAFNLGRSVSRYQRGEYTFAETFNSAFGTLAESLNPLGDTNWETALLPTVADPVMELAINKDYKGDPIYKEASPFGVQKPDSQLYWTNTNAIFKNIASAVNGFTGGTEVTPGSMDISPEVIEYWTEYFTGAAGAFALRTAESPTNVIDSLRGDLEGELTRELPFIRKVFTSPSSREDTGKFIENRDRILRAGKEIQYSRQSQDPEREALMRKRYANELKIYGQIKAINNYRNQLVRNKNKIQSNLTMPEEQKRPIIRRLREKIQMLEKKAAIIIREAGVR